MCKTNKDKVDFNKKSAAKDGLQPACRVCSHERFKAYYAKDAEKQKQAVKDRNAKIKEETRAWLAEYLASHPCVDCGNKDIRVLEFDHVSGTKVSGVGHMIKQGFSRKNIELEIAKCEVRCRNCHQIKTFDRMGGSWHTKFIEALP